jgi:hypothetical protein
MARVAELAAVMGKGIALEFKIASLPDLEVFVYLDRDGASPQHIDEDHQADHESRKFGWSASPSSSSEQTLFSR